MSLSRACLILSLCSFAYPGPVPFCFSLQVLFCLSLHSFIPGLSGSLYLCTHLSWACLPLCLSAPLFIPQLLYSACLCIRSLQGLSRSVSPHIPSLRGPSRSVCLCIPLFPMLSHSFFPTGNGRGTFPRQPGPVLLASFSPHSLILSFLQSRGSGHTG